MPIADKVAAANRINDLLKLVLSQSGFRLKYRITVNAPPQNATPRPADSWQQPEISVDFAGPDSALLLERNAELLNAFEHVATKVLRLDNEEHDHISFDCRNSKQVRREEIRMAAQVAAERVRKTSMPYEFAPMNSRDRRMLHLTLASEADLKTESHGEGRTRCVVLYPKGYDPNAPKLKAFGRRR